MQHLNLEAVGLLLAWLGLAVSAASLWVTYKLRPT